MSKEACQGECSRLTANMKAGLTRLRRHLVRRCQTTLFAMHSIPRNLRVSVLGRKAQVRFPLFFPLPKSKDSNRPPTVYSIRPPSKRYIQSLLSRIDNLERQLAKYEGRDDDACLGPASPRGSPPDQENGDLTNDAAGHDPVREVVDLWGGLSVGEGQELRFFDTRSNLAMVGEQIDERCHHHLLKFSADRSRRPGVGDVDVAEAVQEALLAKFWAWQNSWQYIVHEGAWNRSREARDNDYCTPVLLYAILAVAARYSDEPDGRGSAYDPRTAGTSFSSKAKQLIFEEIEAPRVPTVIAAALISVMEMSLDIEPAGWTYIGRPTLPC